MTVPADNPTSQPPCASVHAIESLPLSFSENVFKKVNQAIDSRDYTAARKLLDAIERELPPTYPQGNFLLAMTRAKRELLGVYEMASGRRYDRDLLEMARCCYRAARVSRLSSATTARQQLRLVAARAGYLSTATKYRAAEAINRPASSVEQPLILLTKGERLYRRAALYAEKAIVDGKRGSELHALHMRYSGHVVSEELALLRLAATGSEQYLNQALDAWRGALEIAQSLESTAEGAIFPGRFYSLADLKLENNFIHAVAAFRKHAWQDCIEALQRWLDDFPSYYRWTWRYSNVLLRMMGTEIIHAVSSNSRRAASTKLDSLAKLVATEPVGRAGRFFSADVRTLAGKWHDEFLRDATLANLAALFPLESTVDFHDSTEAFDPFASLPRPICAGFAVPQPESKLEVELRKLALFAAVEALLGSVCDYDLQWSKPTLELTAATSDELITVCQGFRWAKKPFRSATLSGLRAALGDLENTGDPEGFSSACEAVKQFVRRLLPFVPVQVSLANRITDVEVAAASVPDWNIERPERDVIYLSVETSEDLPVEPGQYYLPPLWRKGDRRYYAVSTADNNPLLPVRFKPRWSYWDARVDGFAVPSITGVPRWLLEHAIELAAQCSGEDKRVHPKVGTIIILGDDVIAKAYRNQDGEGSHAEEIAFRQTGKMDLTGATVITTLEPCTRGRSNSKVSCADLILHNQVSRVVIGALDPDPTIRGTSEFLFGMAGVIVERFPDDLRRRILELDRDHVEFHLSKSIRRLVSFAK